MSKISQIENSKNTKDVADIENRAERTIRRRMAQVTAKIIDIKNAIAFDNPYYYLDLGPRPKNGLFLGMTVYTDHGTFWVGRRRIRLPRRKYRIK